MNLAVTELELEVEVASTLAAALFEHGGAATAGIFAMPSERRYAPRALLPRVVGLLPEHPSSLHLQLRHLVVPPSLRQKPLRSQLVEPHPVLTEASQIERAPRALLRAAGLDPEPCSSESSEQLGVPRRHAKGRVLDDALGLLLELGVELAEQQAITHEG